MGVTPQQMLIFLRNVLVDGPMMQMSGDEVVVENGRPLLDMREVFLTLSKKEVTYG
jgi:hypothetical protein